MGKQNDKVVTTLSGRRKSKKKKKTYTVAIYAFLIVLMLLICVGIKGAAQRLEQKNAVLDRQIETLNTKIEDEAKRKEELDYQAIYITTKEFVEKFAREKLGLVFEDEIIFRPE